ncbi:hypothetical protein WA026_018693 [Henosepilachna vigintioctopunctata]|uniref:Uncharacterized protein n=1 Tax=Henosepilachna vigintioctopunctata TaxID=420089 RepID=A0AAW1TW17_9CUCU
MLEYDPSERITPSKALNHKFFKAKQNMKKSSGKYDLKVESSVEGYITHVRVSIVGTPFQLFLKPIGYCYWSSRETCMPSKFLA